VVPNQYGDWAVGRGGWCPGLEVAPDVIDLTDYAKPGALVTLSYKALYQGKPLAQDSASRIMLRSWVVHWR